jgi:transcriptional regulator with XRE-family HTH domain
MTVRLRVRDIAEPQGLNLAQLQRRVNLSMSTARRVWYSTSDGSVDGPPLKQVSLDVIEQIADYFGVPPGELFEKENSRLP